MKTVVRPVYTIVLHVLFINFNQIGPVVSKTNQCIQRDTKCFLLYNISVEVLTSTLNQHYIDKNIWEIYIIWNELNFLSNIILLFNFIWCVHTMLRPTCAKVPTVNEYCVVFQHLPSCFLWGANPYLHWP